MQSNSGEKYPADVRQSNETTLPFMGVIALLLDGAGATQVAAALNRRAVEIKEYACLAASVLLRRAHGPDFDTGKLSKNQLWLIATTGSSFVLPDSRKSVSWLEFLTEREHLEVTETRAYFRAFRNSDGVNHV